MLTQQVTMHMQFNTVSCTLSSSYYDSCMYFLQKFNICILNVCVTKISSCFKFIRDRKFCELRACTILLARGTNCSRYLNFTNFVVVQNYSKSNRIYGMYLYYIHSMMTAVCYHITDNYSVKISFFTVCIIIYTAKCIYIYMCMYMLYSYMYIQ